MNDKRYLLLSTAVVVGILIIIGIMFTNKTPANNSVSQIEQTATSTAFVLEDGTVVNTTGDVVIEQVPIAPKNTPPSIYKTIVFATTTPADIQTLITDKVLVLRRELEKDPRSFASWVNMGIYYKMAGDYEGAKLYWLYASQLAPKDFIALGNLGNLYAHQLRDIITAEKYYRQAISNDPNQIYLYIQLAEILRDFKKDIIGAQKIIDQGLVANPNNTDLIRFRESL